MFMTNTDGGAIGGDEFINLKVHGGGMNDCDHAFYVQAPNLLIEHSNIYDTPTGIQLYNGYGHRVENVIIRNNVIHDMRVTASGQSTPGIAIGNGSVGAKVYNNIVYGVPNQGAYSRGIYLYRWTDTELYNNVVVNNDGEGIVVGSNATNTTLTNNISYNNLDGNYVNRGTNATVSNNLFGTNPIFVNTLINEFQLQSSSPAINTGTTVSMVTTDIDGVSRPQGSAYDIGAYEYSGTAP